MVSDGAESSADGTGVAPLGRDRGAVAPVAARLTSQDTTIADLVVGLGTGQIKVR